MTDARKEREARVAARTEALNKAQRIPLRLMTDDGREVEIIEWNASTELHQARKVDVTISGFILCEKVARTG